MFASAVGSHDRAHGDAHAGCQPAAVDLRPRPQLLAGRTRDAVAFLVDGEEYFTAVRAALAKAQRSFFILGWDIDSRMRLVPGGANDGLPEPLCDFLNALVKARRGLRGYVLSWDFAMLYALEREWLPIFKLDWRTHRRLSFRLDDQHPAGASHHQKIVVVDDSVAFVSGYDLTRVRWDTCRHEKDEPRRVDHRGIAYPPFHDVGIAVGRRLRPRARATSRASAGGAPRKVAAPRRPPTPIADAWPAGVEPALTDIDVAIARTEPAFDGYPAVGEIRQLHLDAIASARRRIFAENQYFTSRLISDAFAQRLREDDAPEIAVISPFKQSGWLEISTMGVLRGRNHRLLRAADTNNRYRLYYPTLPWLDAKGECLNIHSKVLVVDDEFLMIGSANLADRSMGTDTECNLALEARGESGDRAGDRRLARSAARRAPRPLARGGRRGAPRVRAACTRPSRSSSREGRRGLKAIEPELDPSLDALVPDQQVLDPERPIDPDTIVADLVPREEARGSVAHPLDHRRDRRGGADGPGPRMALHAACRHGSSPRD